MPLKPAEIIANAASLEPGKQIILTFTDIKKFRSIKSGLYAARKTLEHQVVKIKTLYDNTIILSHCSEEESLGMSMSIQDEEKEEKILSSITSRVPRLSKTPKILQRLISLTKEKESIQEDILTNISLLGPEQASLARTDSTSELYSLETTFFHLQSEIRRIHIENRIPFERIPTDEPENELDLIEKD